MATMLDYDKECREDADEENLVGWSEAIFQDAVYNETPVDEISNLRSVKSEGDAPSQEDVDEMEVEGTPQEIEASRSLSEAVLTREEAELLLSLRERQPHLLSLRAGCTLKNVGYIFLTQQSVSRLIDLDRLLMSHGWDLSIAGTPLLKGVAVLIAHEGIWKLRRIKTWDRANAMLTLEDDSTVHPLQISNKELSEDSRQSDYLVEELNFQMHVSNFEPMTVQELACVYARLSFCGVALKQINRGSDSKTLLQDLVQRLANPCDPHFIASFKPFIDPLSVTEMAHKAMHHQDTKQGLAHSSLRSLFQSWLEEDQHLEDLDLQGALMRCKDEMAFSFAALPATDPRLGGHKRVKMSDARSIAAAAPRRVRRLSSDRSSTPPSIASSVHRVRTRSVSTLHREVKAQSDFRNLETAFASLTDMERALRTTRRDLNHMAA